MQSSSSFANATSATSPPSPPSWLRPTLLPPPLPDAAAAAAAGDPLNATRELPRLATQPSTGADRCSQTSPLRYSTSSVTSSSVPSPRTVTSVDWALAPRRTRTPSAAATR
ncbi:unnamed protein product [Ectocarpus sp. 13 AM-2016]